MTKFFKFIKSCFVEQLAEKLDSELEIEYDFFEKETNSNEIEIAESLVENEALSCGDSIQRGFYHFAEELMSDTDTIYETSEKVQKDW